ncbi:MAG: phosphatidylserine/phosphatidylglycerophosphate/cardiolipin synthase family protein [Verrucomicrobiota bacterium]|nr:phosphatidylserine/phosphatidylglycerophosphate/cardiolipin synthase family protein [Verrucomicrobiota bacterium]
MDSLGTAEIPRKNSELRLFTTVDAALQEMLAAIDAASKSIRFEMYIYRASPIGETFREALTRAARRGVTVQVLCDALGSVSLPEKFWDPLTEAGGSFRWFNPLQLKRLGFRNHRKLLVIDDEIAFIGGFNIAPEYQGDGLTKGWHDAGMRLPAVMARQLSRTFDEIYTLADYRHRRFARFRRTHLQKVISTPAGNILTTAPGRGPFLVKAALLADMRKAMSLDIISAYFLPPRQLRRAMLYAIKKGGRVRLLMAGKSDVALSQMACRNLYTGFLQNHVEIYEYEPQILHTKFFIFDNIVYAGSANMDKRSLMINYELLVRIEDKSLADEGRYFFETALSHSTKIELRQWQHSRTMLQRLKEKWAFFVLSRVDPYLTQLQLNVLRHDQEQSKTEPPAITAPQRVS